MRTLKEVRKQIRVTYSMMNGVHDLLKQRAHLTAVEEPCQLLENLSRKMNFLAEQYADLTNFAERTRRFELGNRRN